MRSYTVNENHIGTHRQTDYRHPVTLYKDLTALERKALSLLDVDIGGFIFKFGHC